MEAFLSAVLPLSGYYCLMHPQGRYKKHIVVESIPELVEIAKRLDAAGRDVYFAIGALKQPKLVEMRDGVQHVRTRVTENVRALRAIALDLDVEPNNEKKYPAREEAIRATKAFFATIDWPAPLVVSSGNGLHLYILLEEEVTPDEYQVLLTKFKAVAAHAGYKFDVACTDVTRVLRVAGTHNYKDPDNPKPVQVLRWTDKRVAFDMLMQQLDTYITAHGVKVSERAQSRQLPAYLRFGSNLYRDIEQPLDYDKLRSQCVAIAQFDELGGHVGYAYWMHALQVLRFCEDGRALAHTISSRSPKYDEAATDKILNGLERNSIPPTVCDTFAELDETAAICAACPHRGKVKTPATFGRDTREVVQRMHDELIAATGSLPDPPYPFSVSETSGITKRVKLKSGEEQTVVIYPYPIWPVRRVLSERTQSEALIWRTTTPTDGEIEITVDASALYDSRSFAAVMAANGVYCDPHHMDSLRAYMVGYAREMQRLYKRDLMVAQMGWRDNGAAFAYGEQLYLSDGSVRSCLMDIADRVRSALQPSGSLDAWKDMLRFYEPPQFAPYQFALGTAFGSVLMQFTGLSGGIINIVGQSGEGKSTVQKIVNSVWGHPLQLMLPAEDKASTYNAKISFINQMRNLPICAEEITNASPEEVGGLAYAITQGSEKWRADRNGQVRESLGGWCTTMLASSNVSLYEKLQRSGGAMAKALRIFEYRVPHVRMYDRDTFRRGVDLALLQNYGVAGPVYLRFVMQHIGQIREQLVAVMAQIDKLCDFRAEERVWTAVIATNLLGLEIARKCGLHRFDLHVVKDFVLSAVTQLRAALSDLVPSAMDLLSALINEHIASTFIVESQSVAGKLYVVQQPKTEITMRYDVSERELAIAYTTLQQWCQRMGVGTTEFINDLKLAGVDVRRRRLRLGAGGEFPTAQARCVTFDLRNVTSSSVEALHANIARL